MVELKLDRRKRTTNVVFTSQEQRDTEVKRLKAEGVSNRVIAKRTGISSATVSRIMSVKKPGTPTRTDTRMTDNSVRDKLASLWRPTNLSMLEVDGEV